MTSLTIERDIVTLNETAFAVPWLRFSCPCATCRHSASFQRIADLSVRPDSLPEAITIELGRDGELLHITWREDPVHHSTYRVDWLLDHAWNRSSEGQFSGEVLWDTAALGIRDMRWHDAPGCHAGLGSWTDDLFTHGFALLRGTTEAELQRLLAEFEPVHHTEYGRYADVRAVPEAEDLSEMSLNLTAHTDYPYRTVGPLLEFCYFVENQATGGEFFFLDGFKAAEDFRTEYPAWFALLATTPVEFEQLYSSHRYLYRLRRPVITLGPDERVQALHFGHSHAWSWQVPPERAADFYRAYHTFLKHLACEQYRVTRRFEAGECLAFRNTRILHGRHAFDPSTGTRRLITAYIPWDQLEARMRFHRESPNYLSPPARRIP
ncbi:TauD/TfdA family dioxygenase [Streptomyces sp. BA2]|uniref:TauD/TfdA family dioxygenase n=1 Tax=Streptomyces sp. BA2 TaxID=436595 RepID=UPI00136E6C57|nr:TauD/TfdA family dioxygenase [Streptomyces sp. BA2]